MMTDPVADMLTRIRNGVKARHKSVDLPASKLKAAMCKVLKDEGYIKSFKILPLSVGDIRIRIALKDGAIRGLQKISTPGYRKYKGYKKMHRVLSGLGISIISSSRGVISSRVALKEKVGGEILCDVW